MKNQAINIISTTIATLGCLFLVSGCQTTPKYNFESAPEVDFTSYKTFAMMPLPKEIPGGEPGLMLRVGDIIQSTLEDELKSKGYTQVDIDSADFTVNITGKIVPRVDVTNFGYVPYNTYPSSRRWGYHHPYTTGYSDIHVDEYEEGTLIIEVYDAEIKELVWVGWTTGRRDPGGADPELINERVRGVIAAFPAVQ